MILVIVGGVVRDYGFSAAQQDELWHRWKEGASLGAISRSLNAAPQHVQRFLRQTGGLRVPSPRRSTRHLAVEEREEISRGIASNLSARTIAKRLGRPASTVSREIRRNGGREAYRAWEAETAALQRARRPKKAKLACEPALRALVAEMLDQRWSPEQIAGRLRLLFPEEPGMRVSHETIYLSLFDPRRRAIDRKLSRRLRTARPMRRPGRCQVKRDRGQ
jgi:transposase, IS30 family